MMLTQSVLRPLALAALVFCLAPGLSAQTSLQIYGDSLVSGWENWSWSSTIDLSNPAPVQSGTASIEVDADTWGALSLHHAELDMAPYVSLSFWIHGGSSGGQQVQVVAQYGGETTPGHVLPALPANQWQHHDIPLSTLGIATVTDLHRFSFQLTGGGTADPFYMDDIVLQAVAVPSIVHLQVNVAEPIRTVDNRMFGANTAIWDNDFGDTTTERTTTVGLLEEMGLTTLRFPGGSLSDEYHWATGKSGNNNWAWNTTFAEFTYAATNTGAEVFITVNYGSGTPEEAAGWVRHANITNNLGFQYWEIGNENYGTWETDENTLPNHAYTYATRAQEYMTQMKAADPTIKVGMVVTPGEDAYDNGYTDHPAYNPRTGETHYGWTPVLLSTLKDLGVTPDFLVHHHYPQWTNPSDPGSSPDDDGTLLQSTGAWADHAADLRQQIEDYFGPGGTNIELVVTENNSDAGAQGRQSTSLVNGLYYADSLAQLMKTEFNAFVWWDLRNGTDTGGYFGSEIYGWRNYGDLGMINGLETRHPTFYGAKLMKHFARANDTVLDTTSEYSLLACYAVQSVSGGLNLLVINKSLLTDLNAEIQIDGFVPAPEAAVFSYGIPQDEAARTNAPLSAQDIATDGITNAGATFVYNFPPLTMTVFNLTAAEPEPPMLQARSSISNDEFVFELQGDPGFAYTIEQTTNFLYWESVSTNLLNGVSLNITNPVAPGSSESYWRAVWWP